jgi:hypothetical protein
VSGFDLQVVTLAEFASVDEAGAEPLLGTSESNVIPQGGIVVPYGDGGAGKTTLSIDMLLHLAAGDSWLGVPVSKQARVLIIENEGPRALFRRKLRRKLEGWRGSPLGDRVRVLEEPWALFSFTEDEDRSQLARLIRELEVDVVVIGPVTAAGMLSAGTIPEVRAFVALVETVQASSGRDVTFVLIHHENKAGAISGAWEGVCDTLLHVTSSGHGKTRIYFQKARWSSEHHQTTMHLLWADGESFALENEPDAERITEQILEFIGSNPGTAWAQVEIATPGIGRDARMVIRNELLRTGQIANLTKAGLLIYELEERKPSQLFLTTDPEIRHLLLDSGAAPEQLAPARETELPLPLLPAPALIEEQGVGAADSSPDADWAENVIEHPAVDADPNADARQIIDADPGEHLSADDWAVGVIEPDEVEA